MGNRDEGERVSVFRSTAWLPPATILPTLLVEQSIVPVIVPRSVSPTRSNWNKLLQTIATDVSFLELVASLEYPIAIKSEYRPPGLRLSLDEVRNNFVAKRLVKK